LQDIFDQLQPRVSLTRFLFGLVILSFPIFAFFFSFSRLFLCILQGLLQEVLLLRNNLHEVLIGILDGSFALPS